MKEDNGTRETSNGDDESGTRETSVNSTEGIRETSDATVKLGDNVEILGATVPTGHKATVHELILRLQPDLFGACSCGGWTFNDERLFTSATEAERAVRTDFNAHVAAVFGESGTSLAVGRAQDDALRLDLEYAEESAHESAGTVPLDSEEPTSKKEQIIKLYESGVTDIAQIVRKVAARPSYVAQVLQGAGLITGYFDLYTTTAREQNVYTRFFRNVLDFKTVERARESVKRINRLYDYFERLGDRAGQHQAMVLALTGKNRARWSGKYEESEVFSEWLNSH